MIVTGPVAENRRARYDYEILDTLEAGIMLTGTEVKSLRAGQGPDHREPTPRPSAASCG